MDICDSQEDDLVESADQAEDSDLDEVRKAWDMGKSLGLSLTNEIDAIWAMAKELACKSKKEKMA